MILLLTIDEPTLTASYSNKIQFAIGFTLGDVQYGIGQIYNDMYPPYSITHILTHTALKALSARPLCVPTRGKWGLLLVYASPGVVSVANFGLSDGCVVVSHFCFIFLVTWCVFYHLLIWQLHSFFGKLCLWTSIHYQNRLFFFFSW